MPASEAHAHRVSHKHRTEVPAKPRAWTRPDEYLEALARRRTARRAREDRSRTEPVSPRPSLSTIPFLGLTVLLALLALGIMLAAIPGQRQPAHPPEAGAAEKGYAPKGWLQEAQREMR